MAHEAFHELLRRATHGDFYFVQVGANDGVTDDPLHEFVREYNWSGLLVEPLPDVFERLRATYAGHPELSFENVAVAQVDGPVAFFRHPRHSQCSGLGVLTRMQRRANMRPTVVQGLTFDRLLAKHHIRRHQVDLLQIDTEGYDFEIIKLIPWQSCTPRIIHFENKHLVDKDAPCNLLASHGYACQQLGHDTLAILSEFH